MTRLLLILMLLTLPIACYGAACDNATIGAFSCVQKCSTDDPGATSSNCAMAGNVTSGDIVFFVGWQTSSGRTLTASAASCTAVPTFTIVGGTLSYNTTTTIVMAWGKATSTGACTLTLGTNAAGELLTNAVEISGTNGTLDSNTSSVGTAGCNTTCTSPSVTIANAGALAITYFHDGSFNNGTFTASGDTELSHSLDVGIFAAVKSSTGATTLAATYSAPPSAAASGVMAFMSSGGGAANNCTIAMRGYGPC